MILLVLRLVGRALLLALLAALRLLAVFRPHFRIAPKGVDYLDRWYLTPTRKSKFAKWWRNHMPGVFLHCFLSSDPDRGWHSHPWQNAWSVILCGEYFESRPKLNLNHLFGNTDTPVYVDQWQHYGPGRINKIGAEDFHKVKLISRRVWTLFIVGPLHGREWEFMNEAGKRWPHGTETPGD
jgi:hypothetical protein